MSNRTPESALKQYKLVCDKLDAAKAEYTAKIAEMVNVKAKIRQYLIESGHEGDVHEWLIESDPALAWVVSEKSDGLATQLHMKIDDQVIPEIERQKDEVVKPLKQTLEDIESWALAELLKRGAKNFSTDLGTASLREDKKFSVADKVLFVESMREKGALSELTVTVRPNSKAMAAILEQDGEYPAGLQVSRVNKVVFVKS